MKNFYLGILILFFNNTIQSQEITGDWYGELNVQGTRLPLVFHISRDEAGYSGTMDSPKQGAYGLGMDEVNFEKNELKLVSKGLAIEYLGTYEEEDELINGIFKQGGMTLPLDLSRNAGVVQPEKKESRPQEPKAPFPYITEDVTFNNSADNITLAGTLSLPEKSGSFPAVVLITGSGPQNRDSEVFNHKPFLVIADHLTRNGIAVLRYDDRGVGESQGDFSAATANELGRDVQAAVDFLASRKEIDKDKIGLIGHSEGGSIAPMVANQSDVVSFLVLLAGQSLRGDRNILLQKKLMEERSGIADAAFIDRGQKVFGGAYEIILNSEQNDPELTQELTAYFKEKYGDELSDEQLKNIVRQLTTPWMKNYLKYDPVQDLEKIKIPVLALFGEKDFQVPPTENSAMLRDALEQAGNQNYEIVVLDDLNHLFQESETGLLHEYDQIEQTISPEVLELISNWVLSGDF